MVKYWSHSLVAEYRLLSVPIRVRITCCITLPFLCIYKVIEMSERNANHLTAFTIYSQTENVLFGS